MPAEPAAHEARYQWTPAMRWAIAGDSAAVLIAALLPMPLVIRVLIIAVFGYFGLYSLAYALSRKIAFRADQTGIALGGGPFRHRSTTCSFPWADISKIVIWQRRGYAPTVSVEDGTASPSKLVMTGDGADR